MHLELILRFYLKLFVITILFTSALYSQVAVEDKISVAENKVSEAKKKLSVTGNKVSESENKISETENKISETDSKIFETENKVSETENKVSETENKVSEIENEIFKTEKKISEIENKLSKTKSKLTEVENKLLKTKSRLSEIENKISNTENSILKSENKIAEIDNKVLEIENGKTKELIYFPAGLHFLPLRANIAEAKFGVFYMSDNANLKVDIGNAMDLIKITFPDSDVVSAGVEFMAYANAISYSGYRLQISAIDGLFGGNITYSTNIFGIRYYERFRYMHNSAHQVDGYYNGAAGTWINNREPIPFTRDYAELTGAAEMQIADYFVRPYGAFSYAVRQRPKIFERSQAYMGTEIHTGESSLNPSLPFTYFGAFQTSVSGMPKYQFSLHIQLGIKFGKWESKGTLFYVSYFQGTNYFNEFYDTQINRFGLGFFVDFP